MRVISPCPVESSPEPLSLDRRGMSIRLDAGLVEKAVLLAVENTGVAERRRFHAARDPIYEIDTGERREECFQALHAEWFEHLALGETLVALLAEQPSIAPAIDACLVMPAGRRKDEHADLREARRRGTGRPTLVVQLCPESLVNPERLERLLERELCYVADMLDPAFDYDPDLAVEETSGPLASVLRERHELLWRVSVDGRLDGSRRLAEPEIERLRCRFQSTFSMLGPSCESSFQRLFEGPRPSHRDLLDLARHPLGEGRGPSGVCPLCRMHVPREQLEAEAPSNAAIRGARADFPNWRPEQGLCPHCADLYELRERAGRA
jgi:hypothetical protein